MNRDAARPDGGVRQAEQQRVHRCAAVPGQTSMFHTAVCASSQGMVNFNAVRTSDRGQASR